MMIIYLLFIIIIAAMSSVKNKNETVALRAHALPAYNAMYWFNYKIIITSIHSILTSSYNI